MYMLMCAHVCLCMWKPEVNLGFLVNHLSSLAFQTLSLTERELTAAQRAFAIILSLLPMMGFKFTLLCRLCVCGGVLGIRTQVLRLHDKPFTRWPISTGLGKQFLKSGHNPVVLPVLSLAFFERVSEMVHSVSLSRLHPPPPFFSPRHRLQNKHTL